MFLFRVSNSILILSCLTIFIFSQTPAELPESKRVWLENLIKDTAQLKLPENKAVVYARLGRIYWRIDKNRARQLFRESIAQLNMAQRDAELDRTFPNRNDLVVYGETRRTILEMITAEDEELGFELFEKSRSETTKNALQGISPEPAYHSYNGMNPEKFIIQREDILEQTLITRIAYQNPARAINYFRQNPRPNPTHLTIEILQILQTKNKAAADEIASEIIERILTASFTSGSPELNFAGQLLSDASNRLKIDTPTLHRIAAKVADFLIKEADRQAAPNYTYLTSVLIKYLPERKTELEEKTVQPRRSVFEIFPVSKAANDLLNSEATPEKLLSEADKFPAALREQIYVRATNRIALDGEVERAKEILAGNFPKERLPELFRALSWQLANHATEKGEFDKALGFIEQTSENSKFQALIHLALKIKAVTPDDKPKMLAVLAKARRVLPEKPTTAQEFNQMIGLASAYVFIEPETGFSLLEILVKKYSEISEAAAMVDSFQKNSNIRQNEYLMMSGQTLTIDLGSTLNNFIKVDFERTIKALSRVSRLDRRIRIQLSLFDLDFKI